MPAPAADEFTVASYNLERFFDTVERPGDRATPRSRRRPSTTGWPRPRSPSATSCRTPDILGVVEVENLTTLQALAARINADAVAAGQPDPSYVAYLVEGNDIGGIDVGFLVKTAGVGRAARQVIDVMQEGKTTTLFVNPDDLDRAAQRSAAAACCAPSSTTPNGAPSR